jgi:hypothetical protein
MSALTNTERARKIAEHLDKMQWTPYALGLLTAQLDEVERETRKEKCCPCDCHELIEVGDGCFTCIDQRTNARAEGFRAAQDKAAEIVNDDFSSGIKMDNRPLAERIRRMEI